MSDSRIQPIDSSPFPEVQWVNKHVLLATSDLECSKNLLEFLSSEGMQVTSAVNAVEARSVFEHDIYDLLVIDTDLEGDGLGLGHGIKLSMLDDFVPLLFVTSRTDDLSLASCFEAGGDDLIIKPYSETLLFSRINALLKMGGIYRQQFKEREELAYYHAMMETEQQLAKSIFSSIVHQDYLDRDNIQYTLSPMSIFNGDVLLSATTPNGHEYILLGDFTGHGLTASVGTLPVSEIFYAMTAKGFALSMIIGEINRRLRRLLPVGMFMAAYAIDIDQHEDTLSVWGGGIPDLLLRRVQDNSLECIQAKNLPLGIVDNADLTLDMEIIPVQPGDRFYIYTDGVTETENKDGGMLGSEALQRVISASTHEQNIYAAIMSALDDFRAGHEQSDDITLLEYTYRRRDVLERVEQCVMSGQSTTMNAEWSMQLKLDPSAIRRFDPRPLLTQLIIDVQGLYSYRSRLYTVLSELFSNAVDYGLLGMKSSDKLGVEGVRNYALERQKRLDALSSGYIVIRLKNTPQADGGGSLSLTVEDSGDGFDFEKIQLMPDQKAVKGLQLLARLSDELVFEGAGNRVTVKCHWHFLKG